MFKKTLSAVLALVMTVASFAMLAIPTSADTTTTTLENLYEFDSYAKPSTSDGTVAGDADKNYASSKLVSVNAGDKIYIGPVLTTQGYHFTAYKSDNTVHTKQVKIDDGNTVIASTVNGNVAILCYTVPEGVASIRWVVSQIFTKYAVMTKNAEFTTADYVKYWEAKNVDIKAYLGVDAYTFAPEVITNVSETGGKFFGRADTKAASATTTNNLLTDSKGRYYCTEGYVEVKPDDVVYFVCNTTQAYHLCLYDEGKNGTTTVNGNFVVQYETLMGDYAIYAYKVREGTKYVRYTFATAINNAGLNLMTVNQPFNGKVLTKWAIDNGGDKAAIEALIGVHEYIAPVEPEVPTPPTSDAAIAIISLLGTISLAGAVVLGKKVRN